MKKQQVKFSKPIDARRSGIEVVYQDLALCDNLTAADNIFLSRELFKKFFYISFLDYKKMYDVSFNKGAGIGDDYLFLYDALFQKKHFFLNSFTKISKSKSKPFL